MKTLKVIASIFMAGLLLAAPLSAQTANDQVRLEKTSLFQQNVKIGNIADAVEPWAWVYENYPSSTLYIYVYGAKILNWQIAQAPTDADRAALVDKLMKLYDDRIQYFGQNAKYPTPYILGLKALDYVKYHPADDLKKDAYGWLETSIAQWGSYSDLAFLQQYFDLSTNMYVKDKAHGEKYIADFVRVNALLDESIAEYADNEKKRTTAETLKKAVEAKFVSSGAADCAAIDAIFGKDLEANKTNQEWLNNALKFFKKLNCVESDTYFAASEASHKIAPSVESAKGCADLALKNKEYTKVVKFLEEAASLSNDKNEKAEINFTIAQIYCKLNNYVKAKAYCQEASALKPGWGSPYILTAELYAQHAQNMFNGDATLNATIYWAIVDKLEKAKSVDASCAGTANSMISKYKVYYPKAEEVFMRPELEVGKSFHIGGWVNENVICR